MKNKNKTLPDFIMIPYQLVGDSRLAPLDRIVYGIVMWLSKMQDGKCTASNASIAKLAVSSSKTVSNCLARLEALGYLNRTYDNRLNNKMRTEITPLVDNKNRLIKNDDLPSTDGGVYPLSDGTYLPSNDGGGIHQLVEGVPLTDGGVKTPVFETIGLNQANNDVGGVPSGDGSNTERVQNLKIQTTRHPFGDVSEETPFGPDNFTSLVKKDLRYDTPELVPEKEVSDAIALFLPVFPSLFVTGSPFAVMPNRNAVKKVLMRYDLPRLKILIDKYVAKKEDKFRPEANTIATFCGLKFDRIESYVSKSAGGLWAQQSISTPEQRATREEQYTKKINISLERTMKAKEEWEKAQKKTS